MPSGVVALVGARVITMANVAAGPSARHSRRYRERDGPRRRQSHHRDRTVVVGDRASRSDESRRQGQDDHAGDHRCARAPRRRIERAHRPIELAARRQPGVRRHHVTRSVERQRDRVHQRRARARGRQARPARVLDRDHPLRRRDTLQVGRRELRGCVVARQAPEGARGDQRQELQPAAARRAPDDRQGGARAGDPGRARRRVTPLHEPDAHPRRAHRRRALVAGSAAVQGHGRALCEEQGRLHPDADRRLRWAVGRVLLVSAHQRLGERAAPAVHAP